MTAKKKCDPNQWFCSPGKTSKSLKKKFRQKIFLAYLCRYGLKNGVWNFLKK